MTDPIVVSASPLPAQLAAGVRQGLAIAGPVVAALAAVKGSGDAQIAVIVAGAGVGLLAVLLGQLSTRRAAQRQAVMATALPDSIATTK